MFIIVNQLHNIITKAAFLKTALTIPNILPTKYNGIKYQPFGARIVKLSIALALIKNVASIISQTKASGLDR
tara:strand:+ start:379 stop:594 length:216 start_codon:yes stop_codon:yes gene_type:complete